MKAAILAGGFGTRLRPLTMRLPKPMVPMGNRPLMERVVELLRRHGIHECVSLLYFQPELITQHFRDGAEFGVSMSYVSTEGDLGTAGSVKFAEEKLQETFLVISADLLTDLDLAAAVRFHRERKALATIVLTRVENPLQYGVVFTDAEGRITRFLEKPSWGEVFSDTVNTGIYLFEPEVFAHIPPGVEFDFGKNLFPLLLEQGRGLYGFVAEGYWKDLGTLEEYRKAHEDALAGRIRIAWDGTPGAGPGVFLGEGSRLDEKADVPERVVLGRNCTVGPSARLVNSVLGDNCTVEAGASVVDSVVWGNVSIGRNASLKKCTVASGARIRETAEVEAGAVVSELCTVGRGARVRRDVKIWPNREVEDGAILSTSLIWGEKWSKTLFGAECISGVANSEITPEFAARLGAAFGATLPKGSMLLSARDSHKISRLVNRALVTGVLSTGVNVLDLGVTPVPVHRFAVRALKGAAASLVRRSPYDPELVDVKFYADTGQDLPLARERSVEALFFREDFRRASLADTGEISFPTRQIEHYKEAFLALVSREVIRTGRFKIVLNYAFGPTAQVFPSLLEGMGCEVVALDAYLDQGRLTKTPAEFAHAWEELATIVRTVHASLGVMFDAGGEKIFVVDDRGKKLTGVQTMAAFLALHLRAAGKPQTVAVPVTAPRAMEGIAEGYGGRLLRTRAGARAVQEACARKEVALGAEPLGGFVFPSFHPGFDAMAATARLLELLARNEMRLSDALATVTLPHVAERRVYCPREQKGAVMRRLLEHAAGKRPDTLDGVRFQEGMASVLLLPDPERAFFHVQAESASAAEAKKLASTYDKLIGGWVKKGAKG